MRKSLIATIIIFLGIGQVWGDSFTSDGTTRLYFENNEISGLSNARWVVDGGTAWIQVANSSSIADDGGTISAACVHVDSYKYYIVVPEGTWSHFRLYRGTIPNKDSRWNATGTIAFDGNSHNFLTSYASADGWADATWSSIETVTIYTIPDSLHTYANEYESRSYTWGTDGTDLYANIQLGDTYWNKIAMENTGRTYNGKAIYSCSFIALYGGVKQIQFQLYNGETYKGEYKYTPDGSWAANNVFADKTYVGYRDSKHTWINFITYELDGGTMFFADTQTSYNIESATITLHAAAKSGYVFAGWYSDEDKTIAASTIPTGSTGDKTFYAKWTPTTCVGEHSAGTVFHMIMDVNSEATPTDVDLSANQYADLSSYAIFNGNRGTAVYGTKSSSAKILKGGAKERRRLQMTSTSHVVTLNLSCPLVAYDTIIIYGTHATSAGKTYEFSITSSSTYSNTNSTSGATVSKTTDTTRYVVPVGSGLIGVTPIYIWGSASSDLRIRQIEIHRTRTWQLTYHGNGTSDLTPTNVPAAEYRPASPVALSSTVPVLGEYTFAGWNTATDGSGTNYASGADYTIPSATTTLYAKWTLDVTLNDNGGTGGSTSVTMTHKSKTHSAITLPTRAGYEFVGYYNRSDGGTQLTDATGALLTGVSNSYLSSDGTWKYSTAGLTLYAQWTPVTVTYIGGEEDHVKEWNRTANWSPTCVPTINHDVIIAAPVEIEVTNAKAKSVVLYTAGDTKTGKLTVKAGKALAVATTILKTTDGITNTATTAADIILESDGTYGTGALVAGMESHNTAASVQFFTKAKKNASDKYVNQYFGVSVDSVVKNPTYYGAYLRKFDVDNDAWASFKEEKMYGFTAYRIMRTETTDETYTIQGNLILPGTTTNKDKVLTLTHNAHLDNMFANSWTAPIDITKFDESDFVGAVATVYVFNAGSSDDYNGTPVCTGASAGNWNAMPVEAVKDAVSKSQDTYELTQIPSQQAFLVQTTDNSTHTLTLDYKKLVYDPISANGATIIPTRAPQRTETTELELMQLILSAESGLGDRVLLYQCSDFANDALDNGWEAYKLPGSDFAPQLCAYSPLGEMAIAATDDVEGTVLGFYSGTQDNSYTFSFGYDGSDIWYLNDLMTQQSTRIAEGYTYHFTAAAGSVAESRFVISHTPIAQVPTEQSAVSSQQSGVRKVIINGKLFIVRDGRIYTVDGITVTGRKEVTL